VTQPSRSLEKTFVCTKPGWLTGRYSLAITLAYVLPALLFLLVGLVEVNRIGASAEAVALERGRGLFGLIELTRDWNARHGGVYAPVTEKTQPNSYLQHPRRDITSTAGIDLTMINPAYMTRQIAELAEQETGVRFHITSLKPIRPLNAADPWEAESLQAFAVQGLRERVSFFAAYPLGDRERPVHRYMAPLLVKEPCMKCHEAQGYKIGEIRGGISVTMPAESLLASRQQSTQNLILMLFAGSIVSSALLHLLVARARRHYSQLHSLIAKQEDFIVERTREVTQRNEELRSEIVVSSLREKELRLAGAVFESASEAIMVTDGGHRILRVNPGFEAMTGFAADELHGKNASLLYVADQRKFLRETVLPSLDSAGSWRGEIALKCKDGSQKLAYFAVSRVHHAASDDSAHYVAVLTDITARKQVEMDLKISAIAFEAQEGMFITDAQRNIVRVNQSFTRITGYSAEEVVGMTPRLFRSGRHSPSFYAGMNQRLELTGSWEGEVWNRRKNGEVHPEWLTITAVRDDMGNVMNYVATLTDITDRKQAEEEIRHLAFYDPLTSLPNRRLTADRLASALIRAERRGRHGALMLLDLDNFKTLNDTIGHDAGDMLLVEVARRLEGCVRQGDTVARMGGDEFVIILEDLDGSLSAAMQAEVVASKVLTAVSLPYFLPRPEGREVAPDDDGPLEIRHDCTASIGIAMFADQSDSPDELMKRADTAMYQAKSDGRNAQRFFDRSMREAVETRARLEGDMRRAIVDDQFLLHYQPQIDSNGWVTGAECLVRWRHPQRGLVSPAEFIPVAEETGLILPIGFKVLQDACRQLSLWAVQPEMAHLSLAVNISARQFSLPSITHEVLSLLDTWAAPAARLKLELTESMLFANADDVILKMNALRARGVHFSLDDFGTGYSSLSYLKRLPLDQLKIDQSFVRDVMVDPNDAAIARTILALGQELGMDVIAEGVETTEQRDFLASAGCHAYQGYLFSRPLPLEDFEAFVRASGK
jgi:diguanylate cyclase (GGDEF)-like protein/PAS domain S-box-containing protein